MEKSNFEYIDADSNDEELKCAICIRPFLSPVCDSQCGHTFCQQCIQKWLKNSSICPTCRRQRVNITNYTSVTIRAALNQVSRLPVKCTLCQQMNIDDRNKHFEKCPKQIIKCSSSDIQCPWEGKREELDLHLEKCSFQQIRPIIDQLIKEIKTIKETQCEQQRFIQAFINNGYTLSHLCTMQSCHLNRPHMENQAYSMPCSLCNNQTHSKQIALHCCVSLTCICKSCLNKNTQQLPAKRKVSSSEESDNGNDYRMRYSPSSYWISPLI